MKIRKAANGVCLFFRILKWLLLKNSVLMLRWMGLQRIYKEKEKI